MYVFRYFSPSDLYSNFENIFFNAGIWEYIEELREFVIDLDSRVEKAQINATQINKLMKGDAKPVFTRYDDGRPAENLFNKEGKDQLYPSFRLQERFILIKIVLNQGIRAISFRKKTC
jgi:hypothetical protein